VPEIKTVAAEGADRMIVSANIGLIDVLFLAANVVGGANEPPRRNPPRRSPAPSSRALPAEVPAIETGIKGTEAFLPRPPCESASRSSELSPE